MASAFPNLPGFVPDSKQIDNQWFRRVSANQQEKNKDRKNVQPTLYPLPRWNPPPKPDETGMHNGKYLSTTHDSYRPKNLNGFTEENSELYQPDFVKMDRHTLRFYGYFKESCVETPLEAYRTRRVIVYFYLEDNSVQMIEPKQQNSGIPQGVFLRRQKVLRADESGLHISVDDFRIGQDTMIFGKNVHIYDCDVYTREFYENYGQPQGLPESFEEDAFAKSQVKIVPNKDYAMKDYMEHKLGGGKVSSAKQFLENDRKVLKFYVFSQIPFILHFFLADDTVEIREINFQNSGRDPFPVMLRRQKLPRKFALNQPGQTYAEDFVRPEDIKYGEQLEVYGRKFLVNGCDPFTARFFKEKFGVDFPVSSIEQPQPKDLPDRQIPPYNGFGDEEDSLGYVYRLIPKAPRKDFFKWVDNQVNLRFVARLNTKNPEDVDRRFIITFFLNDETIQVFEPSVRNSGIPDGKFLERKKYKNVERNSEFFLPTDFIIDRDVIINSYSFRIMESDEFTKKWFTQNVTVAQH